MSPNAKVTKYRRRKNVNIGVIVFLIIFVYVIISVFMFFTKEHLTIYEVKEGTTADDFIFQGLIFRKEKVIYTDTAGYINYYHRDGDRIAKSATIYSVDANKNSYDLISSAENSLSISEEDDSSIKNEIKDFQKSYENGNFIKAYQLKSELEGSILQIVNDNMLANLQSVLAENGEGNTLKVAKSPSSGIITYTMDGYEDLSADSATAENFNTEKYSKTQLRTMELIEKQSPVYKIVSSDKWSVMLLLNEEQYNKLQEKDSVKVTFSDDGLTAIAPITLTKKGSDYYATLTLDKYMIHYINQRFVTVEIAVNSAQGLKIPVSSIVDKEFYLIPLEYFTEGGNTGSKGLNKEVITVKDGKEQVSFEFVPTDIYYSDEDYGYVDGRLFETGDWIIKKDTEDRYQVLEKKTFEGAYNVNKGYAVFRRIEMLYKNEEYCIIKKGTAYGLSMYDNIALEGNTAIEQAIIY